MQFYLLLILAPIALTNKTLVLPSSKFVFKSVTSSQEIHVYEIIPDTDVVQCAFFYLSTENKAKLFGFNFGEKACVLNKLSDTLGNRNQGIMWHTPWFKQNRFLPPSRNCIWLLVMRHSFVLSSFCNSLSFALRIHDLFKHTIQWYVLVNNMGLSQKKHLTVIR